MIKKWVWIGLYSLVFPVVAADKLPPPPPPVDKEYLSEIRRGLHIKPEERSDRIEQFTGQVRSNFPVSVEEVTVLRQRAAENQKAITTRGVPKKAVSRDISWTIGSDAPTIYLATGFVTTLVFFGADGAPLPITEKGSVAGDEEAIDNTSVGNAIVLYVKRPWVSTNLTVFLQGVPVPVQMTLTSELEASAAKTVDYQVRVRVIGSGGALAAANMADMQNMDSLMRMVNGLRPEGAFMPVQVATVEKGDSSRLKWSAVRAPAGTFSTGPDGNTYAVLHPGLRLVSPSGPTILGQMKGADEANGYIISGAQSRVFTAVDGNGSVYRLTLKR